MDQIGKICVHAQTGTTHRPSEFLRWSEMTTSVTLLAGITIRLGSTQMTLCGMVRGVAQSVAVAPSTLLRGSQSGSPHPRLRTLR